MIESRWNTHLRYVIPMGGVLNMPYFQQCMIDIFSNNNKIEILNQNNDISKNENPQYIAVKGCAKKSHAILPGYYNTNNNILITPLIACTLCIGIRNGIAHSMLYRNKLRYHKFICVRGAGSFIYAFACLLVLHEQDTITIHKYHQN